MAVTDYGNMFFDPARNVAVAKSGGLQKTFERLQAELNRFAIGFGRPLLVVDGVIGPNTIGVALAAAQYTTTVLPGQGGASGASAAFLASDQTAFALGTYSEGMVAELAQVGDTEGRAYEVNPTVPGQAPSGQPAVTDRVPDLPDPPAAMDTSWMWWVAGTTVVVGSFLSAYVLWKITRKPRRMVPA